MKNFREQKAYRLSLYLLLFSFFLVGVSLIGSSFSFDTSLIPGFYWLLGFSPIYILISLILRFISLDVSKRWTDFIFLFLSLCFVIGFSGAVLEIFFPCPFSSPHDGTAVTISLAGWCHTTDTAIGWMIAGGFSIFAFVKAALFLIADIKQKKESSIQNNF